MKKTLHVLFTGLVSPKMLSGGDQLFLDIAPRLPKSLKIIVITPHFAKIHWEKIEQSNIEFRLLPANRFELKDSPVLTFLSYIVRAWQTYRILKKEDVQTIYSCSDIAYADIWPAYWITKRNHKVKWISRIYHIFLPPGKRQGNHFVNIVAFRLQRLSFWMMKRQSSTIFALNQKLFSEALELGFPKNKLAVLGAGIDFQTINRFKPTKKYNYDIAVLGRVAPVKGIFDMVKIWEIVHARYPKLNLAWIGGGQDSYINKTSEILANKSLSDSFHLLGFLDKEEVYNVLSSAKIFLCPDHENGWGLAVCEAMALGLPVVSYDLDIFGEVYKKGFRSAPLFDTVSFANKLLELLDNEPLRRKIAKEAIDQASQFDHQRVISVLNKYI
ncbi:MAG: glycosyltransferase family 4 protein [Candidatus Saccharimonadales bacterium]